MELCIYERQCESFNTGRCPFCKFFKDNKVDHFKDVRE